MAAHLGSILGVPDLHKLVMRPADDVIAVPREGDGSYGARVTRQRVHLPPTHLYLMGVPRKKVGSSVSPLVLGRPDIIISGLAETLSGLLKPDCRDYHVQIEES